MTTQTDQLYSAAARLARTAPDAWEQFTQALTVVHNEINMINLLTSPSEQMPVLQGRAQATARLLEIFAECKSKADKIEEKRK